MTSFIYPTYAEAKVALDTAEQDVIADHGEAGLEAGYGDLVRTIANCCPPEVGAELIRRNL